MISLLLILILGFASCNNKDIILILGYNYNNIKLIYKMDELDKIDTLDYRL